MVFVQPLWSKRARWWRAAAVCAVLALGAASVRAGRTDSAFGSMAAGDYQGAVAAFDAALAGAPAAATRLDALIGRAEARRALGFLRLAEEDLLAARALATERDDARAGALVAGALGTLYGIRGDVAAARRELGACLDYARARLCACARRRRSGGDHARQYGGAGHGSGCARCRP